MTTKRLLVYHSINNQIIWWNKPALSKLDKFTSTRPIFQASNFICAPNPARKKKEKKRKKEARKMKVNVHVWLKNNYKQSFLFFVI